MVAAVVDVQTDVGDKAAQELGEQTGVDVRYYRVDVRDGGAMGQTVQGVEEHYSTIDILVNATGIAE